MEGKRFAFRIEKLVVGGLGLGRRANGLVVLVPGALPGEEILVEEGRRRRDFVEARLVEVLEPSPVRTEPVCPHYGRCGGCDLQHVTPPAQATLKGAILRDHLLRAVPFAAEELDRFWQEPLAAPEPFGYRQRLRLQVENGRSGFFRPHSHRLEPVAACPLARPEINEALEQLAPLSAFEALLRRSRALELLVSPDDGTVVLLFHFDRRPRPADRSHATALAGEVPGVAAAFLSVADQGLFGPFPEADPAGPPLIRFTLPAGPLPRPLALAVEPGGFCQVNPSQNENLVRLVLDWAGAGVGRRALDLFCGMGNFSLPLALVCAEVTGFDLQRAAIRSARQNAERAGIDNCRFDRAAAVEAARMLAAGGHTFDLVLLDPPRQGCVEVIPLLPALGAGRLIAISCDPATLARDLAALIDHGYIVERLRLVDMFPQTHHMETVVLLERRQAT